MKINIGKQDIIWSYVGTIMSMGANFLMLPFLMYYLDGDMLGLWYVFVSIGAISTLFDFGFSVTFARNITYCWSGAKNLKQEGVDFIENREPDFYMMKQVLVTCKIIYGLLSGIALFLMLTAGTKYIQYISKDIPTEVSVSAWIIYAIAVTLNLYYGYFASFLRGIGNVERVNKNTVYARIIQIFLTVLFLFLGTGIIGASIAYLAYGTIFRFLCKYYFYRYKDIKVKLEEVRERLSMQQMWDLFLIVWHNAWRDGIISISSYLCNQASIVICSMYLSLEQTGSYSIGVQIASAIAQIAGTLYTTYQPELQASYINMNKEKLKQTMSLIVMSFLYLFGIGTILFIVVGIPLLQIIKPEVVVSVPILLGLCVYQAILKYRNCFTSYFSCTNRIVYLNSFVVSAVVCVVLSFIMIGIFDMGIWGLIISQIISQAMYNMWHWPNLVHKELNMRCKEVVYVGTRKCVGMIKSFVV